MIPEEEFLAQIPASTQLWTTLDCPARVPVTISGEPSVGVL